MALSMIRNRVMDYFYRIKVIARWRMQRVLEESPHGLDADLVLSLTSYPARFATLHLTLMSLLTQSRRPDRTVLWIAEGDISLVPESITGLTAKGLEIRTCPDIRSYKKIIPALQAFPRSIIVTADDDAYYHRDWLRQLLEAFKLGERIVVCHRATKISLAHNGLPTPYLHWKPYMGREPSTEIFPTGIGGILYEPGIFYRDVEDSKKFSRLCPTADDIWLYFMAGLNGASWRIANSFHTPFTWIGSQQTALTTENVLEGANDVQFAAMIKEYGLEWVKS